MQTIKERQKGYLVLGLIILAVIGVIELVKYILS